MNPQSTSKRLPLTGAQRGYYGAFLLSMLICWSPWKSLAYLAPIIAVTYFLWEARSHVASRRAVCWIVGWLMVIAAYNFLSRSFEMTPALLTILTYGTIGALFVIPTEDVGSGELLSRMLRLVALVVAIEAAVGIAQGVAGALQQGSFEIANGT